ncbi:MAG: type II secretion system protein [Candidatus Omnitrophica bacterium]|nr:type II secretion system protein [Candidatus Omnitrophota bacterium]
MKKSSFTLIELLIVVIIVGILATVALPQYTKVVNRARGAEAVSNIGTLMRAMAVYYTESSDYPRNAASFDIFATNIGSAVAYPSLNGIGLYATFDETNDDRKWDYGCHPFPSTIHTGDTNYTVCAWPHDINPDTSNPDEMRRYWHGHMKDGQIVGNIINSYTWTNGAVDAHDWSAHQ